MKKLFLFLICLILPSVALGVMGYLFIGQKTALTVFVGTILLLCIISFKGSLILAQFLGGRLPRRGFSFLEDELRNLSLRLEIQSPALYITSKKEFSVMCIKNLMSGPSLIVSSELVSNLSESEIDALISYELMRAKYDFAPLKNLLVFLHCVFSGFAGFLTRNLSWLGRENLNFIIGLINIFKSPFTSFKDYCLRDDELTIKVINKAQEVYTDLSFLQAGFYKCQAIESENMSSQSFLSFKNLDAAYLNTEMNNQVQSPPVE